MLKPETGNTRFQSSEARQSQKIRLKVRFDYRGTPRPNRFFFGGKKTEVAAEEVREHRAALWKNVPLQGVQVEEVQTYDIYTIMEKESQEEKIAYAPLELVLSVDSLEDCVNIIAREEFRTLEILEPFSMTFSSRELEKLLFRFAEAVKQVGKK